MAITTWSREAASTNRRALRPTTADKIKDYILNSGLQPGDPLPTESDLCALLEVSRSNVREAVRTLSTLNIVSVRHGHGSFVGDMRLDALVEALVFRGVLTPGDDLQALRDVIEVRQGLDAAMAHKVAAKMAGTHNVELHDLVAEMVDLASRGQAFPAQDRAFHTSMLARIDNVLVGQLVGAFWDIHTAVMPRLGVSASTDLVQTAEAHGDMLRAAEDGDANALITSVRDHYEPIMRALDAVRMRSSSPSAESSAASTDATDGHDQPDTRRRR